MATKNYEIPIAIGTLSFVSTVSALRTLGLKTFGKAAKLFGYIKTENQKFSV